jgi:hypothetical protein
VTCSGFVVSSRHIYLDHHIEGRKKMQVHDLGLHTKLVSGICNLAGRLRSEP